GQTNYGKRMLPQGEPETGLAPIAPTGHPDATSSSEIQVPAQFKGRVAVVQAAPVAFDRACTLRKVRALTLEASRRGAKLALFPEAFLSAYPRGMTFGAVVGNRSPEGRDWYRRYWDSSVEVPG